MIFTRAIRFFIKKRMLIIEITTAIYNAILLHSIRISSRVKFLVHGTVEINGEKEFTRGSQGLQ
jgi:hypothetical protein